MRENLSSVFRTRPNTIWAVHPQKMARCFERRGIVLFYVAKTMALISCVVIVQLICSSCAFVFLAYAKIRFSHDATHMSLVMRKPDFCICENKGADQLCDNCTTDQRLCFLYTDSTIPLLSKSEISSL